MTYTLPLVTEIPTVALEGEIDPAAVVALQRRIGVALRARPRRIVVDMSAVSVLGAQTMSLFCAALRGMERRGATIALAGAPTPVRRVIELCAIDGLELHPTVAAARSTASRDPAAQLAAVA